MTAMVNWSLAQIRGYLHYWYGERPNEYEAGSVEHDEWQEGWEEAVRDDAMTEGACR